MSLRKLLSCQRNIGFLSRGYSQYSKFFKQPLYDKTQLDKVVESGELEAYKHIKVKAARDDETYSVFHDVVLAKFTNYIMQHGKKSLAREQLMSALTLIKEKQVEKYNKEIDPEVKSKIVLDPVRILKQAVQNCRPIMKLAPVRRGGLVYQVPAPITETESLFRAMRSLVHSSRDKEGPIHFYDKLAHEILDAYDNRGRVVKQKIEIHKTCEVNRAYAHYRWR